MQGLLYPENELSVKEDVSFVMKYLFEHETLPASVETIEKTFKLSEVQ